MNNLINSLGQANSASEFNSPWAIAPITEFEINAVSGGSDTSETAAHVAAVAGIVTVATAECPPVAVVSGVVSIVAGAVAIWF